MRVASRSRLVVSALCRRAINTPAGLDPAYASFAPTLSGCTLSLQLSLTMLHAQQALGAGRWPASGHTSAFTPVSRARVVRHTDYHSGDCLIPAFFEGLKDAHANGATLSSLAVKDVTAYNRCGFAADSHGAHAHNPTEPMIQFIAHVFVWLMHWLATFGNR